LDYWARATVPPDIPLWPSLCPISYENGLKREGIICIIPCYYERNLLYSPILKSIEWEEFMRVGQRLRQLREMAGWSQGELSRKANVPQAIISRVENGQQYGITLENARRLARALGVTIDLLAGAGDERPSPDCL